jgi:hypothetical protein
MHISLLAPGDPSWDAMLATTPHDFYHLPSYVALCARQDGAEARALSVDDGSRRLLLPLLLRDGLDATSPYGYPGPLGDSAFTSDALRAGMDHLRSSGIVSVFVRLHPILDPEPPTGVGTLVGHGDTVAIDLTATTEALWSDTRSDHRSQINRALRAGHRAWMDEEWRHYDAFKRIYRATMERVGASDFYHFDDAYFDALRASLGASLHLAVVEIDGAIAAAGLFVETDGLVEFHLSGTEEAFLKDRPTKLMLHSVRSWAKDRGDRVLHLGGGVGGAHDSLFDFKAGFSKGRHPFHTLRLVCDPERYAELVRANDPDADPTDLTGFFPAYRRGSVADIAP